MNNKKLRKFYFLSYLFIFSTIANIDKDLLYNEIQGSLYNAFVYEMAIAKVDMNALSQGNSDLKKDLIELYDTFDLDNLDEIQKHLNKFTEKWGLKYINMSELD